MTAYCGYQHCGHDPHDGPCPACPCPHRRCACGALITLAVTVPARRPMPLERGATRDPTANVAVWDDRSDGGRLLCRVLKAEEMLSYAGWRGKPHWGNCPKAASFRKPRRPPPIGAAG